MKRIIYILLLTLLSCNSSKLHRDEYITAKEIINSRPSSDFNEPILLYYEIDSLEIVYNTTNSNFALKNKNNNKITNTEFSYLAFLDKHYLFAKKKSSIGIVDVNLNEIIPFDNNNIKLYNNGIPFFLIEKNGKQAIFDYNGKEIYPFKINYIKSEVIYKDKAFLTIEEDNSTIHTLRIYNSKVDIINDAITFKQTKNNLASVFYTKNSYAKYGVYNMENDQVLNNYGGCFYNKFKNEFWVKSKRNGYQKYDIIIDSTFTEKPNMYESISRIENDYYFIETEKGVQIMDLNYKIAPFTYPKIESYDKETSKYSFIYGNKYSDYLKKIFKFYVSKDSKKYGIIDIDGNIIIDAEKYNYVTYSDLNNLNSYNKNLPSYKQQYLRENKLDKLFYAYNHYSDKSGEVTIFRENGKQLISIPIEKEDNCYLELSQFSNHGHLMAKCKSKMKIYDLNTKNLVFEIDEPSGYLNFKERYLNGYYYFSFEDPRFTKINYLSNKLKLLHVQEVTNDSVWHKLAKGNKIYFKKDMKFGLIDFDEKEIVEPIYDKIDIVTENFNIVATNKKYGVITNNNKIVIELVYDKIIYNISNQSFDCYLNDKVEIKYINQIIIN